MVTIQNMEDLFFSNQNPQLFGGGYWRDWIAECNEYQYHLKQCKTYSAVLHLLYGCIHEFTRLD